MQFEIDKEKDEVTIKMSYSYLKGLKTQLKFFHRIIDKESNLTHLFFGLSCFDEEVSKAYLKKIYTECSNCGKEFPSFNDRDLLCEECGYNIQKWMKK